MTVVMMGEMSLDERVNLEPKNKLLNFRLMWLQDFFHFFNIVR